MRIGKATQAARFLRANARQRALLLSATCLTCLSLCTPVAGWAQSGARIWPENGRWVYQQQATLPLRGATETKVEFHGEVLVQGGHTVPGEIGITLQLISEATSESRAKQDFGQPRLITERSPETLAFAFGGAPEGRAQPKLLLRLPDNLPVFKLRQLGGATRMEAVRAKVYTQIFAGRADYENLSSGLVIFSGGGEIRATGITGDVEISSGVGNVDIVSVRGAVRCELGSGSISVKAASGPVELSTGSGNISAQDLGGSIYASTQGGLLEVYRAKGPVVARNREGILRVSASKDVQAYAVTGPIQVRNPSGQLNLSTASGNVYVELRPGVAIAASRVVSEAGDITVHIPERLSLTVVAESGCACTSSVISDFPGLAGSGPGSSDGSSPGLTKTALNGGGPTLRLVSYSGRVVVKRSQ